MRLTTKTYPNPVDVSLDMTSSGLCPLGCIPVALSYSCDSVTDSLLETEKPGHKYIVPVPLLSGHRIQCDSVARGSLVAQSPSQSSGGWKQAFGHLPAQ